MVLEYLYDICCHIVGAEAAEQVPPAMAARQLDPLEQQP
jgi:hypothetical protein